MPAKRIGEKDRRILIQRNVPARDSDGAAVDAWQNHAVAWAAVENLGGSESFQADGRTSQHNTRFTIRFQPGISPLMQVVFDGEPYRVEDVSEIGRRTELILTCSARDVVAGEG